MKDTKDLEIRFLKQDNEILRKALKDKEHECNISMGILVLWVIYFLLVSLNNIGVI